MNDRSAPRPESQRLTHQPLSALKGKLDASKLPPGPPPSTATPSKSSGPSRMGRVTVRRERKGHGGKAVTIAEGPGLPVRELPELAREAARALGTGARVEGAILVVQGNQPDRLVAWLASRGFTDVARGN